MHTITHHDEDRRRAARQRIRDARRSASAVLDARRERMREDLARRTIELAEKSARATGSHA